MKTTPQKAPRRPAINAESIEAMSIEIPNDIRLLITEAYEAAGLDFSDWHAGWLDMLRREISDTLTDGAFGIMDHIAAQVEPRQVAKARKAIARWRDAATVG